MIHRIYLWVIGWPVRVYPLEALLRARLDRKWRRSRA